MPEHSYQPQTEHVREAEIRVFDRAPGTDDASDMYVMDVLGVSVLVRRVIDSDGVFPRIMIEASGPFQVGVNEDINDYGQDYDEDDE